MKVGYSPWKPLFMCQMFKFLTQSQGNYTFWVFWLCQHCFLVICLYSFKYTLYWRLLYRSPCKVGIKYLEDGTKVRVSRGQGASGNIIPRPEILKIRTTPRPTVGSYLKLTKLVFIVNVSRLWKCMYYTRAILSVLVPVWSVCEWSWTKCMRDLDTKSIT